MRFGFLVIFIFLFPSGTTFFGLCENIGLGQETGPSQSLDFCGSTSFCLEKSRANSHEKVSNAANDRGLVANSPVQPPDQPGMDTKNAADSAAAKSDPKTVWIVPTENEVKADLVKWFDSVSLSDEIRTQSLKCWSEQSENSGEILFNRTVQSLRLASPEAAVFFDSCDSLEWNGVSFGQKLVLPSFPSSFRMSDASVPPRLSGVLVQYLAQKLIRIQHDEEALELLKEMTPANTIDPVAVLFYRGIACNQLMIKKEGTRAVEELQETLKTVSPEGRRFSEIAKLLEKELKQIEEDSEKVSNIARRMQNIQRRLGDGKTDKKVQDSEKGVLDSLDKLIEKLEKKQQQSESAKQSNQGGQGNPANESRVMRQKGPGNVADKSIGSQSGWGDLPPKAREEALQRIEKDFPSHYRNIIEEYFRQMSAQNQ